MLWKHEDKQKATKDTFLKAIEKLISKIVVIFFSIARHLVSHIIVFQ